MGIKCVVILLRNWCGPVRDGGEDGERLPTRSGEQWLGGDGQSLRATFEKHRSRQYYCVLSQVNGAE